jgi:hypothetical protein
MKSFSNLKFKTLLTLLFAIGVFLSSVWAASDNTVTISYSDSAVKFSLYNVGSIDSNNQYSLNEQFAAYSVAINDSSAAQTLAAYIQRDNITPTYQAVTNSENKAVFSNVEKGIYIAIGETYTQNKTKYTALPSLFAVDGDVAIKAKYETTTVSQSSSGGGGGGSSSSSTSSKLRQNVSVYKEWKGADLKSRTAVTVQLLKNGEVYGDAELNSANNWRYTWKNLSTSYDWTVVEKTVPDGFEVSVDKDGDSFVITNTKKGYVETTTTTETTTEENVEQVSEGTTSVSSQSSDVDEESVNPSKSDSDEIPTNVEDDTEYETDENGMLISKDGTYNQGRNPGERDSDNPDEEEEMGGKNPNLNQPKKTDKLPQTGQLWWPVPVLAFVGLLIMIIGEGRRREDK